MTYIIFRVLCNFFDLCCINLCKAAKHWDSFLSDCTPRQIVCQINCAARMLSVSYTYGRTFPTTAKFLPFIPLFLSDPVPDTKHHRLWTTSSAANDFLPWMHDGWQHADMIRAQSRTHSLQPYVWPTCLSISAPYQAPPPTSARVLCDQWHRAWYTACSCASCRQRGFCNTQGTCVGAHLVVSSRCVQCFGSISWVRRQCVSVSCKVDSMFFLPLLSSTMM